jgi:hypothetical protein
MPLIKSNINKGYSRTNTTIARMDPIPFPHLAVITYLYASKTAHK